MASVSALAVLIGFMVVLFGAIAVGIAFARNSQGGQRDNPNLVPCRDCGQYISVRAATCPHCGGPNKG